MRIFFIVIASLFCLMGYSQEQYVGTPSNTINIRGNLIVGKKFKLPDTLSATYSAADTGSLAKHNGIVYMFAKVGSTYKFIPTGDTTTTLIFTDSTIRVYNVGGVLSIGVDPTKFLPSAIHKIIDATGTVNATDGTIIYTSLTANRTLNLPNAALSLDRKIIIRNPNPTYSILLSSSVRQNSTTTIAECGPNTGIIIQSDGSEWWVVN